LANYSVEEVISGIDPSRGASPPPSFVMKSCKRVRNVPSNHQSTGNQKRTPTQITVVSQQ